MHNKTTPMEDSDGQQRLLATLERLLAIETTEVKSALDQASQLVADILGADKVDTFLHDRASDTLVAVGTSNTPMGRQQQAIGMDRLPVANRGRNAEVFRTGAPFLTGQADTDPAELVGIKEGLGIRSTLAVPLEVTGERRGVLVASAAEVNQFSEEDLLFLLAVARWIGSLVHRAELIGRIAQDAANQARPPPQRNSSRCWRMISRTI